MGKKLTEKQKTFCREYIVDKNGAQAAIRAGYSKHTAKEQATRLLTNVHVMKYLAKLISKQAKRTEITADYVRSSIQEIGERCMQRVPVLDSLGHETGEWKFEHTGANKAFENLGRHLKMFTEKIEVEDTASLHPENKGKTREELELELEKLRAKRMDKK